MKKELTALREQLVNNTQELKAGGTMFCGSLGLKSQEVYFLCDTEHDESPWATATGITRLEETGLLSPLEHNLYVFVCLLPLSALAISHPFLL